ncbi:MAG TPA: amino acid ABC transporter permease [Solirubrobacterales bacterium]|nr:amino acid ABC transporter permease [Solirubrobacterales bacterium]
MGEFFDIFFNFQFMADHFDEVFDGFLVTLKLSAVGGFFALVWGLILAVLRQLPGKLLAPVRWIVIAYIDCLRGIPMLLMILLLSSGLATMATNGVIPREIGIPQWLGESDPFWYGVMALTLTYGAYMAEVYRAGIEAVPRGQTEAARSLGMSHGQAMRFVIVPQAVRKVIPPLLNDFIALMKDTALVSTIGLIEVVQAGRDLYSEFFNPSGYTLGAFLFLIVTIPLARVVDWQIKRQNEKFQRGMP